MSAPHSSVFARLASGAFYETIKSGNFEDTGEKDLNRIVRSAGMIVPSEPWQIHPIG
jgi:hypothetical protein